MGPDLKTRTLLAAGLFVLSGCDPILEIFGAFFPSWTLCTLLGIALAACGRAIFVRVGLDPWLGPPILIYPSLAVLLTSSIWLLLFRT